LNFSKLARACFVSIDDDTIVWCPRNYEVEKTCSRINDIPELDDFLHVPVA